MKTLPVVRSFTGWFPPWWPNFNFLVSQPSARPIIWCPIQIPQIGYLPINCLTVSTVPGASSGSPGPFERNTRSGFASSITEAGMLAGNTVILQPLFNKSRIIPCFAPISMKATCGLPVSFNVYTCSAVVSIITWLLSREFISTLTSSSLGSPCIMTPFIVPASRITLVSALVSIPSIPTTPCWRRKSSRFISFLKLDGKSHFSLTTNALRLVCFASISSRLIP